MTTIKRLIKTTLTPIAVCLSLAIAAPAMAEKGQHKKHDGKHRVFKGLSLTDTQKQDIRLVLKQSRADRSASITDDKALRTELRSIVQSTEWDQAAVESVISQHQAQFQEKALKRASNQHQVWNLLTESQQAELTAKLETRKDKLKEMGSGDRRKGKGDKRNRKGQGDRLKHMDLSAEQLAAVESIKSSSKASSADIKGSLKAYKQAERALIHSSDFNEQAWKALNAQYQADFMLMAVQGVKTKNEIWNVMTPEQQAKTLEQSEKMNKRKNKQKPV